MKSLTESERAYRRGALQALQFFQSDIRAGTDLREFLYLLALYIEECKRGRVSMDDDYLGTYMDTIRQMVSEKSFRDSRK